MFCKELFLIESRNMFKAIFEEKKKEMEAVQLRDSYLDILHEVISHYNKTFSWADIINSINYDKEFLENTYEIIDDESEYGEDAAFKSYNEAFSYFSLNHLFHENNGDELEELFLDI